MKKRFFISAIMTALGLLLFMASASFAEPGHNGNQAEKCCKCASFPLDRIEGFSELSVKDQAYIKAELEKLKGLPPEEFIYEFQALLDEKGLELPEPPEPEYERGPGMRRYDERPLHEGPGREGTTTMNHRMGRLERDVLFSLESIKGFHELSAKDQAYIRRELEKLLKEKGLRLPALRAYEGEPRPPFPASARSRPMPPEPFDPEGDTGSK